MSLNSLTVDSGSKPWTNLYVNSLTCYNDLTVNGNFVQNGNINHDGDIQHTGDVIIDGELQMSNQNNNNANGYSINVIGDYAIHTDGLRVGKSPLVDKSICPCF